jgi:protein phosphatase methylesterase 1
MHFCTDLLAVCRFKVVAMDMRHHGESEAGDEGSEMDMSRETLQADAVAVWEALFGETHPPAVLVGHSVGGAIAIWTALAAEGISTLEGIIVIDVVEGTAVGVFSSSHKFTSSPKWYVTYRIVSFPYVEERCKHWDPSFQGALANY